MDGIGYGNWNSQSRRHTGGDLEDSYESSSPPTYTSDPYGFDSGIGQGDNKSKNYSMASSKKDSYDFNLTEDSYGDYSSEGSPAPAIKPKLSRRMSTEDRMAEILKNNQKPVATSTETASTEGGEGAEGEDDVYGSWKSSWNQLMEGVDGITSPTLSVNKSLDPAPSPAYVRSQAHEGKPSNLLNSSDSFDLSEADFEVGTHASRRSQEMLEDRRRKSMASFVGRAGGPKKKLSDSPDIHKRERVEGSKQGQKAHFSTAGISSIDPDERHDDSAEVCKCLLLSELTHTIYARESLTTL